MRENRSEFGDIVILPVAGKGGSLGVSVRVDRAVTRSAIRAFETNSSNCRESHLG
jgi:hypothetical protein